jgi:deoxyribonuclease (pyrimidine dimer)
MTRINSAIKVKFLTDEHLLAEHREIKRLPYAYKKRIETGKGFKDIPKEFTLGTGHVLFFINKNKFKIYRR